MDINQFEWVMVKNKPSFWRGTLERGVILFPLFAGATYGIVVLSLGQKFFKVEEMLIILECICIFAFVVANSIWHMISQAQSEKLIHFKISEQGINREKKKISLAALKNQSVEDLFKKLALPYQEWRKENPNPTEMIELLLETNEGKIKLSFPGEYERQKCIRTLQEYLHPSQ